MKSGARSEKRRPGVEWVKEERRWKRKEGMGEEERVVRVASSEAKM